jgi:hypothetical protein
MTELVIEKRSKIDIEPTFEEVYDLANEMAYENEIEFKTHSDWVDFCCLVENHLRRKRGVI